MVKVQKKRPSNIITSNGLDAKQMIQSKEPKNIINVASNVAPIVKQKYIYYFMQATLKLHCFNQM